MEDLLESLKELERPLQFRETSCFCRLVVQERISLLPSFIGRLSEGVIEHLNRRVLRYSDQYNGVLLAYSKPTILQRRGNILDEQPHIHFDLRFNAFIFKPTIGIFLSGTVNKIGQDHIGCLVYNCFNVSVVGEQPQDDRGLRNGLLGLKFAVGSQIWFRVTKLNVVGGLLSIQGEHVDFSMVGEGNMDPDGTRTDNKGFEGSEINDAAEISEGSEKAKKKHKKHKKRKRSEGSEINDTADISEGLEKAKEKIKKRKRSESSGTDLSDGTTEEFKTARKRKRKHLYLEHSAAENDSSFPSGVVSTGTRVESETPLSKDKKRKRKSRDVPSFKGDGLHSPGEDSVTSPVKQHKHKHKHKSKRS